RQHPEGPYPGSSLCERFPGILAQLYGEAAVALFRQECSTEASARKLQWAESPLPAWPTLAANATIAEEPALRQSPLTRQGCGECGTCAPSSQNPRKPEAARVQPARHLTQPAPRRRISAPLKKAQPRNGSNSGSLTAAPGAGEGTASRSIGRAGTGLQP